MKDGKTYKLAMRKKNSIQKEFLDGSWIFPEPKPVE